MKEKKSMIEEEKEDHLKSTKRIEMEEQLANPDEEPQEVISEKEEY
ncbi:hypothetical protein J4481_01030 [Candidatus Pacearchaeota archaeon]|nr:hypothetical protein [Candidatus Pacearchaeota archaeon]